MLLSFVVADKKPVTIFMIGDSTMANKPTDKENQERGWGQALPDHLMGDVTVDNHAVNGRSTKSFIDEGRWDAVLSKIQPGDYVFIQFGHNDEKADEKRHTDPYTTFKANLQRFVREAKAKGGRPVLYNSIVRRNFEDGILTDTHGDYIKVPAMVAREEGVPFVDANRITHDYVESHGVENSRVLFNHVLPGKYEFCPDGKTDNTHLNIYGANRISKLLLDATAKAVPELQKYVSKAPNICPANNATGIAPDTRLQLAFASPVKIGSKGKIRVYDVTTHEMVDSIDVSVPAGPTESRTYGPDCDYTKVPYDYTRPSVAASPTWGTLPTNRNITPGTPSGTAERNPADYQLNIIGGFTDAFHYFPVEVNQTNATIVLHNNVLEYGHTYSVSIDRDVFVAEGFDGIDGWQFTVRKQGPKGTHFTVDATGYGDFCTVQAALDMIPDFSDTPYTVTIAEGDYKEIVYARNKTNVTIQGAGMGKTRVHYPNNEVFNPHPLTVKTNELRGTYPYRRAAFALDNCRDMTLRDITIATDNKGQAEGLFVMGERYTLYKVHIIGDGDALQANGSIYMEDCEMDGGTDAFLSRGTIYAYHCNLRNTGGAFAWPRSTKEQHGLVFVECTFSTTNGRPVDFGRCPNNHGKGYPETEHVLINCKAPAVIPGGWSAIGEKTATFLEYNTCDVATGQPLPTKDRHPFSRQLNKKRDAKLIRNYSNPEWVLGGWRPVTPASAKVKDAEDMSKLSDL